MTELKVSYQTYTPHTELLATGQPFPQEMHEETGKALV